MKALITDRDQTASGDRRFRRWVFSTLQGRCADVMRARGTGPLCLAVSDWRAGLCRGVLLAGESPNVSVLGWDHNAYYHRRLLRRLPPHCRRVLDVGCGAGAFAVELAVVCDQVDALDRSPLMIELAERAVPGNVRCLLADVLADPLPGEAYDAIVSISALHHLPLDTALPRLSAALCPGGVLAVIALPRRDLPAELPVEIVAAFGHRLLGVVFALLRSIGPGRWFAVPPSHAVMPVVLDLPLTTRQVRRHAARILPDSRVRRLVFWRYLLVWHKPIDTADRREDLFDGQLRNSMTARAAIAARQQRHRGDQ